jgi:hypothetical protein
MTITPITTPSRAIGKPMITAKGSVQLSYWAARIRKATTMASIKMMEVDELAFSS